MRLTKKQLLTSLRNDIYVRLGRSSVHGVGIFAIRTIPKGVNPFNSPKNTTYYRYKKQELTEIPEEVMRMIDDYCVEKNGYIYPIIWF